LKWKKYKTKPRGAKTKLDIIGQTDPRNISKILNFEAAIGKGIQPLFSFIGTEYIHVESSDTVNWQIEGKSIDGYKGCWEDKSIKKFLFKWLERIDSILNEIQRKKILAETYGELPQNAMYLFKKAVTSILPDINEIEWSVDSKQPVVKLKNGEIRQFDVLSDGYRYLILLAGELATRSFLLNKLAGKSILKQIYGLVIIDEFGIHLHPALQNEALNRLKNTFPNVQFIVSTHSPLLLNGLKKEQIHILTTDIEGNRIASNPDEDILGLGANDILTKIFGLSTTMDNEFITMNEEYTALFKKKSENIELEASEIERFNILTKALSHLRLDPTLQITTEDPLTTIVKEELANRSALESFTKNEPNPESLKNKVDDILNNLFPNT
jgi:predicted ATP-binding protein involved in virulence